MASDTPRNAQRIDRYRKQSINLLQGAMQQIKQGHWTRSEDLLWGSLTQAVKGVALSRGEQLDNEEEIRDYATRLGHEQRDRRLREAFTQLSNFGESVERLREARFRVDRIIPMLEDVSSAIERLWELVPVAEPATEPAEPEETVGQDAE